jgi:hypothetical protein
MGGVPRVATVVPATRFAVGRGTHRGHRGRRSASAIIASFFALTAAGIAAPTIASAAPATYKIVFYVDYGTSSSSSSGGATTGHGYVQLRRNDGGDPQSGRSDLVYGKYPSGNYVFNTKGVIRSDAASSWTWRITFAVSADQYNKAATLINNELANPSDYKLLSSNCVDFQARVASAAGLTLPNYIGTDTIPDPEYLNTSLAAAGDGATANGGTVQKNTGGTTASGAPDPPGFPECCSSDTIANHAINNPSDLATGVGFQLTDTVLPLDSLNSDNSYGVSFTNSDPHFNLYAIDWGDGTRSLGEDPPLGSDGYVDFSHTYASGNNENLKVYLIENGEIHEYDRTVGSPSGSGHRETDSEDTPPNQTSYGAPTPPVPADLVQQPAVPEVPLPVMLPLLVLGGTTLVVLSRRRQPVRR